jgi:general secretion pathway protein L
MSTGMSDREIDAVTGLITLLPVQGSDALPWWLVEDGAITARSNGQDTGAGFPELADGVRVMALVPARQAVVRWVDMSELAPRQAETAACLKVAEESLDDASALHVVAAHLDGEDVIAANISKAQLQYGLDRLAGYGLNPDVVLPAGLAFDAPETGIARADFGSDNALLRGPKLIMPDDPALRAVLLGDAVVADIDQDSAEQQLLAAFAAPTLNLRSGAFAKKTPGVGISPRQWRILGWMLFAGLLLSLLLALVTYWQYDRAVDREDALALAAARKIAPQATSAADAASALDKALAQKGVGARQFTAPASTLFAEIQQEQGLNLRDMRYGADGILGFTLAAPTADPINKVLLDLQEQGYKVTATPRQDASGLAMAEITMRLP